MKTAIYYFVMAFYLQSIGLLENVLNGLANGLERVGLVVGDLNAELLLDCQDHLDNIKTVQAKVGGERGLGLKLKVLGNLERKRKTVSNQC